MGLSGQQKREEVILNAWAMRVDLRWLLRGKWPALQFKPNMKTETTSTAEKPVTQVIDLEADLNEELPTRTCNIGDGECESCQ